MEEYSSVMNPYAMAEIIIGKKINWKKITDKKTLLEKIFEFPYDKLFDPKYRSPIYVGSSDEHLKHIKTHKEVFEKLSLTKDFDKLSQFIETEPSIEKLGIDTKWLRKISPKKQWLFLNIWFPEINTPKKQEYTPANATWRDMGDFYEEGTEFLDPIQGSLGDCYFIGALASIAWTRPYIIAHRNIPTGDAQNAFLDRITFYDSNDSIDIDVTEELPINNSTNNFIYARSREDGEIWPGVYEKAFAKWKTNNPTDKPDYSPLRGGSPRKAAAAITNLSPVRKSNQDFSSDELWSMVREHSLGRKTIDPMFACTYETSTDAPEAINYADANLVANHCYSILGWDYRNNTKYIILRNPWGRHEATLDILGGEWRPIQTPGNFQAINLNQNGVFGLKAETCKKYYSGISWVS